ncbi:MAG: PQQ-binding-like beta-propeller repeat protein [Oscillospiraceae bacterium]
MDDFRGTRVYRGPAGCGGLQQQRRDGGKDADSRDEGTLYWAMQIGNGYGKDAVGCPILAGDAIITYSGNHIYRIDPDTGKTLTEGTMVSNSSYSIVPPTYSDGMVFVGLKDGQIQAFDAVS